MILSVSCSSGRNNLLLDERPGGLDLEVFRKVLEILERYPVGKEHSSFEATADVADCMICFRWSRPAKGGWTSNLTMPFGSALSRLPNELDKLIEEQISRPA